MRCAKCNNKNKELFFYDGSKYVCRKCLVYKEKNIEEYIKSEKADYYLDYSLTFKQKQASEFILNNIKKKSDCILSAVTGSGKTEIVYPAIKYCVENKLTIGIVIPRKDVVIELYTRISRDFKDIKVTSVYGGHNKELNGDVIILTSHQLYRYNNFFDVIIIDEVDAFPFLNNELLNHFLLRSKRGNIVYMSATITNKLLKSGYDIFYLNQRYHGYKLDVPKLKYFFNTYSLKKYINRYKNSIIIVYFPTIKMQLFFSKKLKVEHYVINSKIKNREELLTRLHSLNEGVILSTLVLERGITFKNTNVIVYRADHKLFSFENLVQISGRVGRNKLYPHGDIIFMVDKRTKTIRKAINFIKKSNE